ncbi:MAG: hypothetical protein KF874_05875 [Rhizobiaceae bacterium]|nr:hypothetical protein [Rhizobiaceae bacterium]
MFIFSPALRFIAEGTRHNVIGAPVVMMVRNQTGQTHSEQGGDQADK